MVRFEETDQISSPFLDGLAELRVTDNRDQAVQAQLFRKPGQVRRSFSPAKHPRYGRPQSDFPPSSLVRYSPKHRYSRLLNFPYPGAPFQPRMNTTVIQIQGISSFNNTANPGSSAAVGVYYGPNCSRNAFYPLPIPFKQTANRAVLEAARCALNNLMTMRQTELHPGWREIIIMTNSAYLKKSLSRWVWNWEQHD